MKSARFCEGCGSAPAPRWGGYGVTLCSSCQPVIESGQELDSLFIKTPGEKPKFIRYIPKRPWAQFE